MAETRPARMSFTTLDTGVSLEAQFNPEELTEILNVDWSELKIQGYSSRKHQYAGTDNHEFSFTLQFNATDDGGGAMVTNDTSFQSAPRAVASGTQNRQKDILAARRFLLSLGYGPRGKQDIVGSSPSRFLFVWPNLVALTCHLHSLNFKHTKFDKLGQPMTFSVDVKIKDVADVRLYSDDVIQDGTFRSTGE